MMLEEVIEFVALKCGIPKSEITQQSKIEADFGMVGLYTINLYGEFFKVFAIQNSENLDLDSYVTTEILKLRLIIKSIFFEECSAKIKNKRGFNWAFSKSCRIKMVDR